MRRFLLSILLSIAALGGSRAEALTVPFTESFASSPAGWRDAASNPLTWVASGGPDGGSYASGGFNYLGFEGPFGSGPIVFRGNASADASGDAFVGNWNTGGVTQVGAWLRHDAPVDLTVLLRITFAGFPAVAYPGSVAVAPNTWTRVFFDVGPDAACIEEGSTCSAVKANVGNVQFGTNAPASLTELDRVVTLDVDGITLVPEPGTMLLVGAGLAGISRAGRRSR